MRVLHVHNRYRDRGGEDTVVDAERRLLSSAHFELASVDFRNPATTGASLGMFAQAPWNRSAAEQVVAAARDHCADVVHIHNTWFALSPAVIPALSGAGFPVVASFHNYRLVCVNGMLIRDGKPCETCLGGSTLPGVRFRCYRDSLGASAMAAATLELHRMKGTWQGLSAAIVLNEFARARLIHGGLSAERTFIKPNFVSDPGPRQETPSRSREVLFVGRLSPEKGIERLLAAWREADRSGLSLSVIGGGPLSARLRDAKVEGLRFLGPLSNQEVIARMLQARALIVPSLCYEVQPMVILEALAAGLPVFHTDLGALAETCGRGGVSIGPGEESAMATALGILQDEETIERAGSYGRGEFEARFSEVRSLRDLHEIYEFARAYPL